MESKIDYLNANLVPYNGREPLSLARTGESTKVGGDCGTDAVAGALDKLHGVTVTTSAVRCAISHLLEHGLDAGHDHTIAIKLGELNGRDLLAEGMERPALPDWEFRAMSFKSRLPWAEGVGPDGGWDGDPGDRGSQEPA
jgi:hypothetical protein